MRSLNQLTRTARDESAREGKRLARNGLNYIALALLYARQLESGLSADEIAETFFELSMSRAREAVSVTSNQEEEFRRWLSLPV